MDSFITKNVDKIQSVMNNEEPTAWKHADLIKIIDSIYTKGFTDGEEVERKEGKTRTHRIQKGDGKHFVIKRKQLDFQSYTKLCLRLGVRLDSDCIDFIGFDVRAFKDNGYEFINPHDKEDKCQVVSM